MPLLPQVPRKAKACPFGRRGGIFPMGHFAGMLMRKRELKTHKEMSISAVIGRDSFQ